MFAVNYAVGSKIEGELMPYNLSENYLEFERREQTTASTTEVIDFTNFDQLIVIAEVDDSNSAGILDLQMKFYNEVTKATAPNVYRYFSEKDYSSQAKVGIVMNTCDFFDVESVKNSKNDYRLDEVINCFQSDIWDSESINLLQNLYSINFNEVMKIFVDSPDVQDVHKIESALLNHGFINVERNYTIPLVSTLLASLFGSKNEQFLVSASISILITYIFMAFLFFSKYKKYVQVSRIVGGNFKVMMKSTLMITVIMSLLLSILASIVLIYFYFIGVNHLSLVNFVKLQVFMLLCNLLLVLLSLVFKYKQAENLIGRS